MDVKGKVLLQLFN